MTEAERLAEARACQALAAAEAAAWEDRQMAIAEQRAGEDLRALGNALFA